MNSRNTRHRVATAVAAAIAFGATAAHAQTAASASSASDTGGSLSEVVVTGTRQTGIEAADSPAPIQVLSAASIEAQSGQGDLMSTLSQVVPSLTMQAFGNDMSSNTVQAKLKGLSPNHVLVL